MGDDEVVSGSSVLSRCFTVELGVVQNGQLPPFILNFFQCPPPANALCDQMKIQFYAKNEEEDKFSEDLNQVMVKCLLPDFEVSYVGLSSLVPKEAHPKYFVVAYDKKTRRAVLIQAPNPFCMRQVVQNYRSTYRPEGSTGHARSLILKFHKSNRSRRIYKSLAASSKLDVSSGLVTGNLDVAQRFLAGNLAEAGDRSDLPVFNSNTNDVKEVYPVGGLISELEANLILASDSLCIKVVTDNLDIQCLKDVPSFVIQTIRHLSELVKSERVTGVDPNASVSPGIMQRVVLMEYLRYLMTLYRVQFTHRSKVHFGPLSRLIPKQILEILLKKFATNSEGDIWHVGLRLKNKLINFVCIIALRLYDMILPFRQLCSDLLMPPAEMKNHFIYIGCVLVKNDVAKLNAPLKLPSQSLTRRRS